MSLYIKHENQTLLWNTIHSHPKFQPHLKQYPPDKLSAWFRSTIEGFYRKWGENRPISPEELKQLNQNTITYLYQSITSLTSPPPPSPHFPQQQQPTPHPSTQHPSLPKPLPDFHGQHEFEQRAQEYQAMNAKPIAEAIQGQTDADQRESQDTMERKWMEQQRLREKDVEYFSPPSQVNGPQAINLNLLKSTAPPTTGTSVNTATPQETENIQIKIREIQSQEKSPEIPRSAPPPVPDPEWLTRIKRMEELQEKMGKQIEQLHQHILSTAPPANTKPEKMTDIDE
jgi:hypothetical protein